MHPCTIFFLPLLSLRLRFSNALLFTRLQDLMVTTNIIQRDISEMEKHSIQKGQHVPKERKRFGKLEFVVSIVYRVPPQKSNPLSSM